MTLSLVSEIERPMRKEKDHRNSDPRRSLEINPAYPDRSYTNDDEKLVPGGGNDMKYRKPAEIPTLSGIKKLFVTDAKSVRDKSAA